ncbi:unnamed protein product, partial [Meganyctiphanes norvegica]
MREEEEEEGEEENEEQETNTGPAKDYKRTAKDSGRRASQLLPRQLKHLKPQFELQVARRRRITTRTNGTLKSFDKGFTCSSSSSEWLDQTTAYKMPGNIRYSQGTYNGSQSTYNGDPGKTLPSRSMSVDSLSDSKMSQEYVPSRISRLGPKVNTSAAMQFVKAGPAGLYKTANEQIKKADTVKALRKQMTVEEEDWQQNLDKWKSSRRKRNEDALVRVIEIKKNEEDEQFQKTRRKSKTFNEMQEDKSKRGRRYNLVVHDDDNSDLSELGLGLSSNKSETSINDIHDENDNKELDNDNKDAKSDAGFCTGSDTGSDGVFAEDNISDTSSALGDKKDAHDSLLDPGVPKDDELHMNGHNLSLTTSLTSSSLTSSSLTNSTLITKDKDSPDEYTYDKAIEGYKQFAVNSVKRRTPSITSLNSNASFSSSTKEDEKEKTQMSTRSSSPNKGKGLEDKLSFFTKEMEKDFIKTSPEPKVVIREKPKIDVGKRRSMFELGDVSPLENSNISTSSSTSQEQKHLIRRASDIAVPGSLKNRVKSFENLDSDINRPRSITPQRDTKFHEKLANFHQQESETEPKQTVRKNTPERDMNFHKKLASFTSINNGEEEKIMERKLPIRRDSSLLRNKIASFEQLDQTEETHISSRPRDDTLKSYDRSVSLEHLIEEPKSKMTMRSAVSTGNVMRHIQSTPYMVVDLDSTVGVEEEVKRRNEPVVSGTLAGPNSNRDSTKRSTIYETVEKCQVSRDVESAPLYSIFQYLSPEVNAQVFELASKLEETPLVGSPTDKTDTLVPASSAVSSSVKDANCSTPYTDEDINEVISDYEQVEGTSGDGELVENIYENITDEYMYENIYEKINEKFVGEIEHQYQTLDEVRSEQISVNEFILPPVNQQKIAVSATPEVLDVTWTDGPSQVAPPSEPPPPPPPDDDSDDDDEQHLLAQNEDPNFTREKSTRRLKKELWRRRSDFLGTSSQYNEEETTVKPPPNLSEILRQECESERRLLESHSPRLIQQEEDEIARREREIIENLERSEKLQQQNRTKYLWEDRMRDDQGTISDMNEVDEHLQYQEDNNEISTTLAKTMEPEGVQISPESSTNISEISNTDLVIPEKPLDSFEFKMSPELSDNMPEISNTDIVTSENQLETLESELTFPSEKKNEGLDLESKINSYSEASTLEPIRTEAENVESEPIHPDPLMDDSNDSQDDSNEAYKKLAELEEEMMRHDKGMLKKLQAATNSQQLGHIPPPTPYACEEEPPVVPPLPLPSTLNDQQSNHYSFDPPQPLPIQEYYIAPSYEPPPPMVVNENKVQPPATSPSQYNTLASPHPYTRSHSQSSIHPPLSSVRSTPGNSPRDAVPEPLPRKKNLPPPPPEKPHQLQQQYIDINSNERQEALRLSRFSSSESSIHTEMSDTSVQSVSSGQHMSKQTLLALSAIPKPKLTENESWIKRKAENKKDYSKHWLIQEAEQRRLEDQDRIPRQKQGSQLSSQQLNSSHHHSSSQQISSPQHSSPPHTSPSSSYISSSNVNNSSHANNINNNNKNWRNASTTYQPTISATSTTPPGSSNDKALPDSIIHNLTQRVNNKNIKNTYANTNVRNGSYGNSSYRGDENYHDYMNAEALSAASTHAPVYQSAQPQPPITTSQQQTSQQQQEEQDQRLLSVSGKKKCSHCGEELGRGAAMIIESLRLFYHIPCFKCCVCGIQLGNGSAGADVRVRNHKLHCHNCYSNDEGMKFSKV